MQNVFELISVENHNGMIATTSLNVSEVFGKDHHKVLRDIEDVLENLTAPTEAGHNPNLDWPNEASPKFVETTYSDASGRDRKMFLLNRNAAVLLLMSYTGKRVFSFKLAYMKAFDKMLFERYVPSDLPKTYMNNNTYGTCSRLVAEYRKALSESTPISNERLAEFRLNGEMLKNVVGFNPIEEYEKRLHSMPSQESKPAPITEAAVNPYKNVDLDDSLYDDVPF